MMRKPFGDWKPATPEETAAATDFTDEALQAEVERDTTQWINGINQTEQYEVNGQMREVDERVLKGLTDAKPEGDK